LDLERVFHRRRQVGDDVREAAAQGLGDEQRRPDNGDVKEQANSQLACSGWLIQ
jgi:hypothetical protein